MAELGFKKDLPERRAKTRNSMLGVVGACGVVWFLLGMVSLVLSLGLTVDKAALMYSPEQLNYLIDTPIWTRFFNAAGLCAGLIGSGYILMRKVNAYKWYMLSLISLLILLLDATFRGGFNIMPSTHYSVSIIGIVIGVYLFWASYQAKNRGELRTT